MKIQLIIFTLFFFVERRREKQTESRETVDIYCKLVLRIRSRFLFVLVAVLVQPGTDGFSSIFEGNNIFIGLISILFVDVSLLFDDR